MRYEDMTHLMERWVTKRSRLATIHMEESEGIREYSFEDKGSWIQKISDKLLRTDDSLLIRGRWKELERLPYLRVQYMVRDGWLQRPIIVLWRLSLAIYYMDLGVRYAVAALRGRDTNL